MQNWFDDRLLKRTVKIANTRKKEYPMDIDEVMMVHEMTPDIKHTQLNVMNGHLGRTFEDIARLFLFEHSPDYGPAIHHLAKIEGGSGETRLEICDMQCGRDGIDTKYSVNSNEGAHNNRLARAATILREEYGMRPIMPIFRPNNLPEPIKFLKNNGWRVLEGDAAIQYFTDLTGVCFKTYLSSFAGRYPIIQ